MFRITTYIARTRTLLQRRTWESCKASFSRTPVGYKLPHQERDPCPQLPPKPPPPKDDRLLWGTIAALLITGAFAVYAEQTPEVRDWLTLNAPWFDDLIAIMYQENMTYMEFAIKCGADLKQLLASYTTDPKECSLTVEGDENENDNDDDDDDEEEEKPCEVLPPPVITMDICEMEKCVKDLGETAINNYLTARDSCKFYNKLVQGVMMDFSVSEMKKLRKEMEDRLELVKTSIENASTAQSQLNDLNRYLDCGVNEPKEKIEQTKLVVQDLNTNLKILNIDFTWENAIALALDIQWQMVEATIDRYTEDNSSFYQGLDYMSKKPTLGKDPDFLLHHSRRFVLDLQETQRAAAEAFSERTDRALASLPQGEKQVADRKAAIDAETKKRKADLDKEIADRYKDQKDGNEQALKDALAKQLKRHEETMEIKLAAKEIEANKKLDKMVADAVAAERQQMAIQIRDMEQKVAIIESRLEARLKAERETKRAQELWSAGASLLAATKKGDPAVRVEKELRLIEKASGDGDKLVLSVLHAIPDDVWEKGVVPESVLRQRYRSMEQVALQVSLIEDDGAPLALYFLSWLQSTLLFMKMTTIPQVELDHPPPKETEKDKELFKHLDTFDLLQRARYWIEQGNIAEALRYVKTLEGASRGAAKAWVDAAQSYVETRQAAEAILAHAAALGLQYI